jgi:hypothetical protein
VVALATAAAACEKTGLIPYDAGAGDGGTPLTSYIPAGCPYTVPVPPVQDVVLGGTAVGASPAPDHLHASFAGPTESTFAVNWRTDRETTVTQVLYGTDQAAVTAATAPGAGVSLQEGHAMLFAPPLGDTVRIHEVHVCGLAASMRYYYKAGGPGAWSAVYGVATGPMPGAAEIFSFAVSGDARNDPATWAEVQAAIAGRGVDFQLFSGDAVILGPNQPEWDGWFEAVAGAVPVQDVLARVPMMFANGNHDLLAVNYLVQFALPGETSPGETAGEEWYSFDYGNAHFVVLNDTTAAADTIGGAEAAWLSADLGAVDRLATPWVFVMHHKPAYSCATAHGSDVTLRSAWQPIFDQWGVDVVFNGHDHDYERSKPIRGFDTGSTNGTVAASGPGGIPVAGSGTVYVVAAGAGAPLYGVDPSCYHTQLTESVRNYVVVEIDGTTMHYTAYRLDGSVLDAFDYTK